MKLKNIFIYFVVILLVACKKHDVSKVEQHTELKEWLKQNGEGYKNGVLQFKGANGETKEGKLNWSQVKTYDIDGKVYTEVPFMFGEENKGELRSNNSDTKVDVAFYLMLRTISGQIEGAIKVVQQNLALKANNETKNGTIESFRNLKNELVNIWFRESTNNNLIALKLAENQTWENTISSQSDVKSNSCDISYSAVRVITGGGVSPDSSPDNVIVYSVYTEMTMFKIDCSGSINGGANWPPTPPSSGAGGGPDQKKKEPCPLSYTELRAAFPGKETDTTTLKTLLSLLNKYGSQFGLDNGYKIKHFLAQIGHETGGLSVLNKPENLSYTTPSQLVATYPELFSFTDKNLKDPNDYLRNPQKLANLTMCCLYGNNGIAGAGWNYRGRGPMQLTWKENYEKFQMFYNKMFNTNLDFVKYPDLVNSNAEIAMISALWYFQTRVINKLKVIDANTSVSKITRPINAKLLDLTKRESIFKRLDENIDCEN